MNPWVKEILGLLSKVPRSERDAVWEELAGLVGNARKGAATRSQALLTYNEACQLLRCHRSTLHRAIGEGEFREGYHFFRRGRRLYFNKMRLLTHLKSRFPMAPRRTRRGT